MASSSYVIGDLVCVYGRNHEIVGILSPNCFEKIMDGHAVRILGGTEYPVDFLSAKDRIVLPVENDNLIIFEDGGIQYESVLGAKS